MARYDLFRDGENFLLDVQADSIRILETRVVVPIRRPEMAPDPARRLNPIFEIEGGRYIMATQFLAAVVDRELGTRVGNLSEHRDEIVAAMDMLFQGF